MSSLSDVQHRDGYYAKQTTAEGLLTSYLEALSASLIGIIPQRERVRLREEAEFHLERLTNAYMLEGMVPIQAANLAIDKYGSASEVAHQFLDVWYAHHPQGRLARSLGLGIVTALIWFGAATLLVTLLIQYRVYHPDMRPLEPGGSLTAMPHLLPAPWPSVEINPLFLVLWGVAILAPFVAGWMTGCTVLVRSARAVWQVQTALTLYAFTLGMQLLPTSEGLLLALFQLFYWLPVGCLMAHVAAQRIIRRRCRGLLSMEARDET